MQPVVVLVQQRSSKPPQPVSDLILGTTLKTHRSSHLPERPRSLFIAAVVRNHGLGRVQQQGREALMTTTLDGKPLQTATGTKQ